MRGRDLKCNRKHWGWTFRSNIQVIFQSLNIDEERSKKTKPRKIMERKKDQKSPQTPTTNQSTFKGSKANYHNFISSWDTVYLPALFHWCQETFSPEDVPKAMPPFFQWKPARKENRKIHACIYNRLWWAWNKNSKSRNLHILQEWSFHSLPQVKHTIPKRFFSWEKVSNQEWKQTG